MNANHAHRMMLAATDPAEAFGKPGIHLPIAGHDCHVRREGERWTILDNEGVRHTIITRDYTFLKRHVEQWFGGDWD